MRIVFYTNRSYQQDPLFNYIYAHVAAHYPDHHIVAAIPKRTGKLSRHFKKFRKLGLLQSLEVLSSYPLASHFLKKDRAELNLCLNALARPQCDLEKTPSATVHSINGPDAVETIRSLSSDIILQSGAGILRPQIFQLAKIATLNMHHGIAPLIKGMSSIYWGLYEGKPEWLGATIHEVDEGIDTGRVLAYAPIKQQGDERFPQLFCKATEEGVVQLLQVLKRLEKGERWTVPLPPGTHEYRSTISGWKLLRIKLRN
ncbi:MAG: formyl transferase [Verrucomicrobiota bacterium]|nr:formyl transferase [Verrucomicrobiota bacterium]